MARLNYEIESDDDLPELSSILRLKGVNISLTSGDENGDQKLFGMEKSVSRDTNNSARGAATAEFRPMVKSPCDKKQLRQQRPMETVQPTRLNSSSFPISKEHRTIANILTEQEAPLEDFGLVRTSPRRKATTPRKFKEFVHTLSPTSLSVSEADDSSTDLSGFIVPDSASDEEEFPVRSRSHHSTKSPPKKSDLRLRKSRLPTSERSQLKENSLSKLVDLTSPEHNYSKTTGPHLSRSHRKTAKESIPAKGNPTSQDSFAELKYSPPRFHSPIKSQDESRPVTPPLRPSQSKLQSPSKRHRIPPSPHRPSIDAFWSQDVINDWNEQYSPKKSLKSPRRFKLYSVDEDDDDFSPSESTRSSPIKSPAKKDKHLIEQRRAFNERKHGIATSFLAELDQNVGDGRVTTLAESTGGVKIIWSNKLSSTAGRANWRREHLRSKTADNSVTATTYRHHASIELAEKVIDDEDRLINVVAHEYCHLANFMISGVKDNPHGREFKNWARKCTKAFFHRNIEVTTKHSYTVTYKYIWACSNEGCGIEYKRHSKSIDPAKHSCGSCKGKLTQVQPAPRKGMEGKRTEYQNFVKVEYERVKKDNVKAGFGEIMVILGREFRESKKVSPVETATAENSKVDEKHNSPPRADDDDLDSVARKLDFLNLGS